MRRAEVSLEPAGDEWAGLSVRWEGEATSVSGWWREDPGWVMAVVAEPALEPPVPL